MIFFKIYAGNSEHGLGLQYLSGKKMIQPASEVSPDLFCTSIVQKLNDIFINCMSKAIADVLKNVQLM